MSSLLRIVRFTRELAKLYWAIILFSLLTSFAGLAVPFLMGKGTDVVTQAVTGQVALADSLRIVVVVVVGLLIAELASTIFSNLGGYYGDVMSNRLRTILSVKYFDKLLHLPQSWFDTELTGTIVSRLNRSIAEISNFSKTMANSFATMIITTVAVLVISAWYAWPLAVLLFVIFPVYVWLTALTSNKWQKLEGKKNEEIDLAGGRFAEVVGQIRVVRSFVRERSELTIFSDRFRRTDGYTAEQSRHWHLMDILRRGALNLIFFGIYLIIFIQAVQGKFTLGEMVLLVQLINMARGPAQNMSWVIDTSQRAIAGTRDYFAVMETPTESGAGTGLDAEGEAPSAGVGGAQPALPEISEATGPIVTEVDPASLAARSRIRFSNVSFAYDKDNDVLHGVSFEVAPGEKVALVGESGGGKSTIVNLLLALYAPRAGRIEVGGEDVAGMSLLELRRRIGVVFQDAALFSGTIEENIAYGRPDASVDEVREAARRANADKFIEKFDDGYQTIIGERGLRLSGGQRQRVAVARAILKDAPILVLDEATSALDTKAERQVQAGLDELMQNRTSLIIAHRLSTIANVDRIVTLREGVVDEIGSPAELAESGGIYSELLALQQGGHRKQLARYDITG